MKVPEFLLEMSKQISEQDNRITAEPIWVVCYDEWITCANDRGEKEVYVVCDDNSGDYCQFDADDYSEIAEYLSSYCEGWVYNWCGDEGVKLDDFKEEFHINYWTVMPESFEKIELQSVRRGIKYCLTEADANNFISRKQHDYPKLYTYVESMCFCPQMIELRNWIKGLQGE